MNKTKIWHLSIMVLVLLSACNSRHPRDSRHLSFQDSLTVQSLCAQCDQIQMTEPDSAVALQLQLRTIYRHYDLDKGIITTYNMTSGTYCLFKNDLKNGKRYADSGLAVALLPGNEKLLYKAYYAYGVYYKCLGDLDSSAYYFLKALKLQPEERDQSFYENTHNQLADLFASQGNFPSAFKYYQPLIEKANREPNNPNSVSFYMGGYAYAMEVPNNDSAAFSYLKLAFKTAKQSHFTALNAALNFYLAEYYSKQNQLDSSIFYALQSIQIMDTALQPFDRYEKSFSLLINNYNKKGLYEQGKVALLKAKNKINIANIMRSDRIELLKAEYTIDSAFGDSRAAFASLQQLNKLEKEDYTESKKEQLLNHEKELKKLAAEKIIAQKNAKIHKQSLINIVMLLVSLLLVIIIVLIYLYVQKRKKLEAINLLQLKKEAELQQEKALVKMQIEERNRIAQEMHDDLGSSLTNMFMGLVLLEKKPNDVQYLSMIQHTTQKLSSQINDVIWNLNMRNDFLYSLLDYFKKYAVKFLSNAHIHLAYDTKGILSDIPISGTLRRAVYLTLKELLNNIVKYAAAQKVVITFSSDESNLFIRIKDDGIGIDNSILKPDDHKGTGNGLKNIKNTIEQLKGSIHWQDNNGTETTIELPIH